MQDHIAGDITKGRIGMCGCIVEQFGEGQGIFVGDFFCAAAR